MNQQQIIEKLRPIDDTFMQKLCEDKEFCQELLRTVMDKPGLKVIRCTPQRNLHNVDTRSVTVDVLCEEENGDIFSVEVQKANDDDHQKRVRYNGACVQVLSLKKGTKFKELRDVYMVYISEHDFFGLGMTIYHIDRTIREAGKVIDNGYHEVYVNAEVDDGTTLAEYMAILKSSQIPDNTNFPRASEMIKYYKDGKGRDEMCDLVEEYANEKAKEAAEKAAKEAAEKAAEKAAKEAIETARRFRLNGVSDEIIHDSTGLSYEEIAKL